MPDYNPNPLFAGIAQGFKGAEDAAEEYKTRAREFKALQEFADATGIADKDRTTTMDLDSLRGFVRAGEARRVEAERQRATQHQDALLKLQQDQFAETRRMHGEQEHRSDLDRLDRRYQQVVEQGRNREADRRAEGDFALRQSAGSLALSEAQKAAAQAEAQRIATLQAIRAMQGDPALNNSPLARLPLGGAMPDVKALGDMRDLMQPPFSPTLGVQKVTLSNGNVVEIPVGRTGRGGAQYFPEFAPTGNQKYPGKTDAAAKVARPKTDIERHRMIRDHEKDIERLTGQLTETGPDGKTPKLTGPAYFQARASIKRKQAEIARLEEESDGGREEPEAPAGSPSGVSAVPASAVDYLRANPNLRDAFDQKYGPGAAARALGR